MKILLINGSLHEKGACSGALEHIKGILLKNSIEYKEYGIGNSPRYACSGCRGCADGGGCIYRDLDTLTQLCCESDAIIVCTPTHYAAAPGNLTAVISRLIFSSKRSVQHKPIGVIGVGRRAGVCEAVRDVKKFFEFASCPIISGIYPPILYASEYKNSDYDREGVQNIRSLTENVIFVTKCIKIGLKNGVIPPAEERRIKTDISSLLSDA